MSEEDAAAARERVDAAIRSMRETVSAYFERLNDLLKFPPPPDEF